MEAILDDAKLHDYKSTVVFRNGHSLAENKGFEEKGIVFKTRAHFSKQMGKLF